MVCFCLSLTELFVCLFVFQHDILDVNDIFRDLGTMVHEQGDMIGECLFLKEV